MKCPLTTVISTVRESPKAEDWGDCIKEECGFWDGQSGRCSEVTKARELSIIRSLLKDIRDKMPHEEQFRK